MKKYEMEDIMPVENNIIERKMNRSVIYSKMLLYLNLKLSSNKSRTTAREVSKFFKIQDDYAFKILAFFVDNSLVKKVKQDSRAYYMPLKEIEKYVDLAYDKIKGKI